jgi:hypothetical protein
MSNFKNQQLTDVGWDALSVALGGGRITFFKMQAGDGNIVADGAIPPMVGLVNPKTDIGIHKYEIDDHGQITLYGNIASSTLPTGFTFRELGIFVSVEPPEAGVGGTPMPPSIVVTPPTDTAPDIPDPTTGTAIMYSYCNSYTYSDYIPGSGETTDVVNTIQVTVKIDKAANIEVIITEGQQLSLENIGPPSVGAGPWSHTQANVAYIKRLVAGPMTEISEDANTIKIGQKQLSFSAILYVALGNPNVAPHFSSIWNAMYWLSQYILGPGVTIWIRVYPGVYWQNWCVYMDHVNGQQIVIEGVGSDGQPDGDSYFSGVSAISGGPWGWYVTLSGCTNMRNIRPGSWLNVWHGGGSRYLSSALLGGFFPVHAVAGNTVTVIIPWAEGSWPSLEGFGGGYFSVVNVLLGITVAGQYGAVIGNHGIGQFRNIGIYNGAPRRDNWCVNGFGIFGPSNIYRCGVYGFFNNRGENGGFAIVSYGTALYYCSSTLNSTGMIVCGDGTAACCYCSFCHNGIMGIWTQGGTTYSHRGYVFVAGNGYAYHGAALLVAVRSIFISQGAIEGAYYTGNWWSVYNATYGMYMTHQSEYIQSSVNDSLTMVYNGRIGTTDQLDLAIQGLSVCNSASIYGSRRFNIPVNRLSWDGCIIYG